MVSLSFWRSKWEIFNISINAFFNNSLLSANIAIYTLCRICTLCHLTNENRPEYFIFHDQNWEIFMHCSLIIYFFTMFCENCTKMYSRKDLNKLQHPQIFFFFFNMYLIFEHFHTAFSYSKRLKMEN